DKPLRREDEIFRRHRRAIRPFEIFANMKGVAKAILAHLPAVRRTGHKFATGVMGGEAQEQVLDDVAFPGAGHELRIQTVGFAIIAAMDDHLGCSPQGDCEGEKTKPEKSADPAECHGYLTVFVMVL